MHRLPMVLVESLDPGAAPDLDSASETGLSLASPGWRARNITDQTHQSGTDTVLGVMVLNA